MSDKMRESFEEWALSEGYPITRGYYFDVYASAETRAAYLAWQAAQSVPIAKTADDEFEILGEIAESGGLSAAVWG